MKIITISDTHGCHRELELPEGDVLIHAGDICNQGDKDQVKDFIEWFDELKYPYKIFIQGNHDRDLLQNKKSLIPEKLPDSIIYLNDSFCIIDGLKIWGSPFYEEDETIEWEFIPDDADIVITHNPPYEILDRAPSGNLRGLKKLKKRIQEIRPQLHLFGHIHVSYGQMKIGNVTYINPSNYNAVPAKIVNPPIIFNTQNKE